MFYKQKEALYLVSLLAHALGGETPELPTDFDWDNLFALASQQKVEAMAGVALDDVEGVPEKVRAQFMQAYKREISACLVRRNEGITILNALEVNGVDCVPLKGWVMQDLYPNPAMRYMCDLDILFREEQSDEVQRILVSLGYVPQELGGNPEVYFKKPIMNIEMHKRIYRDDTGFFDTVWDRVQPVKGCQHTFSMTWEDYYIYMIAHLYKHFVGGGTGIRYVCDTELFLRRYGETVNRDYVDDQLRKSGILDFERQLRALCRVWFHGAPADEALTEFSEKLLFCGVFGTLERNEENQTRQTVQAMPGKTVRAKRLWYILSLLFPPLAVMQDVYPTLRKAPFFLPVFWLVRGLQKLFTGRDEARHLLEGAGKITEEDLRKNF